MTNSHSNGSFIRAIASGAAGCFVALAMLPTAIHAQAKDDEKKGPPPPEDITLESKDRVVLKATYWEPEEPGKSTVPVIMLHGWAGKRQEYDVLAGNLQKAGLAVVSLDLRGHGGSTTLRRPDKDADDVIDPEKLIKPDFINMVYDVWEAKKFLMEKHKEEKCNIELLCVVGADMGALVAINFAAYDWLRPKLPRRRNSPGQDTNALVLLSPPDSFKGMTAEFALKHDVVKSRVSTMIIVGDKDKKDAAYRDAKALNSKLERFHAQMPRGEKDPDGWKEKHQDLVLYSPQPSTSLQGTKLLSSTLPVDKAIMRFIELRLINKASDFPWQERD